METTPLLATRATVYLYPLAGRFPLTSQDPCSPGLGETPEGKENSVLVLIPHVSHLPAGSERTCVDLALVIHVHLQEPDEHAEEDPKELQIGARLPHLVETVLIGGGGKEKRFHTWAPPCVLLREP